MHSLIFPLLFLCLWGSCLSQGDDKFRQLVKEAQKSPVIHFRNSEMYNKLVSDAGRNYSMIVLFTATGSRYKCAPCGALAEEFRQYGVSYEAYFGDYVHNKEFLEKPFFLAQVEPDNCMDVFQGYAFTTVPHMVYIPASSKKVTKLRDDHFLRNPQTTIGDIINFAKKHVGVEIPIYQTFIEKITPLLTVIVFSVVVIRLLQKYQTHLYSPMLWYSLAVVTYAIVMAGVVYNRTRNPPFVGDIQNGRAQLISPSPRTQYVAEGMVIAVILSGAGILMVVLGDVVPRIEGSKKRFAFWGVTILLFMFLTSLNNIYRAKYGSSAFRLNWRFF